MKKIAFFLLMVLSASVAFCQALQDTGIAPLYTKVGIPVFKVNHIPDSAVFTQASLKKKKPVMFMIFSPECEHCIHAVKELLPKMNRFKKAQLVLASSLPYGDNKRFYEEFGLQKYPNIKVITDPGFKLGSYFEVKSYPGVVLFNKKGRFKAAWSSHVDWDLVADEL